jgi:predicted nuclease of predicted toxin-antitoxin system
MAGTDDQIVIDFARSERRLLVTEDKDFGQLAHETASTISFATVWGCENMGK